MKNFKKILGIVFLITMSKVSALYQGNPASCEFPQLGFFIPEERALGAKLGYQAEYVFNRKMGLIDGGVPLKNRLVDRMTLLFNQAVMTLNVVDRMEAFVTLGTTQISLKRNATSNEEENLSSNNGFTWSIGGRALLLFWEKTSLGVTASYLSSYPQFEPLLLNRRKSISNYFKQNYQEWQIELALSQKLDPISVYIGGAYSYAQLDREHKTHELYKNRYNFSMALGISIFANKGFTMNLESRFFGETSFGGSLDFRF